MSTMIGVTCGLLLTGTQANGCHRTAEAGDEKDCQIERRVKCTLDGLWWLFLATCFDELIDVSAVDRR